MKDLISVIMPTYNSGRYIGESIQSVINQTYSNWELIIVDDDSGDHTEAIVEGYQKNDGRIQYSRFHENRGAAAARTEAMRQARGTYIAFLDSDDLWLEDKLEKQLKFMKKNHINFCCTSYEKIDEDGNLLNKVEKAIPRTGYNRLLFDCPVGNSSVMYCVKEMGKFKVPEIRKRNDDALWLQMLKTEKYIYGYPQVLMQYRIRKGSISSNKFTLIKYHWQLYRDIEHLSIFRSAFHVMAWCVLKIFRIK